MKFRLIPIAVMILTAGVALAATPAPTPPDGSERLERLTILLDLDAGQKAAVQKVMDEQHEQMKAFREQARSSQQRPTREQMHTHREQMEKDTTEKMRAILSDVQMKKYEVLTERPQRHFHKRGMRAPDATKN